MFAIQVLHISIFHEYFQASNSISITAMNFSYAITNRCRSVKVMRAQSQTTTAKRLIGNLLASLYVHANPFRFACFYE